MKKLLEELTNGIVQTLVDESKKITGKGAKDFVSLVVRMNDIAGIVNSYEQLKISLMQAYE